MAKVSLRPVPDTGYISFFKFYGLSLVRNNQQLQGDCPFSDCPNPIGHFFANPGTGQWDCKRCTRRGNTYDFIRQFHEDCQRVTEPSWYDQLAEDRPGITAQTLQQHKIVVNPLLMCWMLPAYNLKREMTNLYCWKEVSTTDGPVMNVMSGPTFKQIAYGLQHYRKDKHRPLFLLEGHWDLLAFVDGLKASNQLDDIDCFAVPGAGTFPDPDVPLLSMRDVYFCYDNDASGEQGIVTAMQKLGRNSITPNSMHRINWDKTKHKSGYDVRDLAVDVGHANLIPSLRKRTSKLQVDLRKYANENYDPNKRLLNCTKFDDLADSIGQPGKLYFPEALQDTFAIIVAIAASVNLGGKPLWSYIIGPSSAGKTTLVELLSTASTHCFGISKMTGLLSGYFKEGMGDASLLPKIQDKCVIIKDFTTILNLADQTRENVFGEMRDAYDGKTSAFYRNHVKQQFSNIRFHMLACVTDKIRMYNQTDVGERFLQVEFDSYWDATGRMERDSVDRRELMSRAIDNVLDLIDDQKGANLDEQMGLSWGFLEHLVGRIKDDKEWVRSKTAIIREDAGFQRYIDNLATWVVYARSIVDRDKDKQVNYRPRVAYAQRLGEQLTKLAVALYLTFDFTSPSERVWSIIRKVALDTGFCFPQEIMLALCHAPNHRLDVQGLANAIGISATHIGNKLRDMQELRIVKYYLPIVARRGNQPHIYRLTEEMEQVALDLGFMAPESEVDYEENGRLVKPEF